MAAKRAAVCLIAWSFVTVSFAAPPPDLIVNSVEAPSTVALGGYMDIRVSGLNQGAQTAGGGFTVQILGPDDRVLHTEVNMPAVGEDGSWWVTASVPVPYIPSGLGYIRALVDAGDSVAESDEDNNEGEAQNRTEVVPRRYAMHNAWVFDPAPGANGDRQANPGERVLMIVRLRHDGPGDAEDVTVSLSSSDPDVTVVRTGITHSTWAAGAVRNSTGHVLRISPDATPHDVSIDVAVTTGPHRFWDLGDEEDEEDYTDRWETSAVIPIVTRPPEFVMRSQWIFDPIPGAHRDGVANPGELVSPRVRLKNLGGTATNVRVALAVDDPDVTVVTGEVARATWPAAAAANTRGLQLDIASAASAHDVTVDVHVTADNAGPWEFTFVMPIVVPSLNFTRRAAWVFDPAPLGNHNRQANPGERIQPRVRLRSSGPGAAMGVRVALSIDDPDVTVVSGAVTYALWEEGVALSNVGLLLDIASDATAHTVPVVIDVTADNGGPWQFTWSFQIVVPQPEFERRSVWLFDPTPNGNKDGQANPGERVLPRVRLKNVGDAAAENVRVELSIDSSVVTVVTGSVTHATWPAGSADNNAALALDIAAESWTQDVQMVVNVTADNGGPWQFLYTFRIVAFSPEFVKLREWVVDPTPAGNRDGQASPGETVLPRIRLRNTGLGAAGNVRVLLSTDDPDVSLHPISVLQGRWPAGEARNNSGITLTIADDAAPHDVLLEVYVTANNGGPWSFAITLPIVVGPPDFVLWSHWLAGDDKFRAALPGERILPRVRLRNAGPAATNVTATIATSDSDATVIEGEVTHAAWPIAEKRNINGFVLDIAEDAAPHDMDVVVTVTADDGGPWQFTFSIAIAAAAAPAALLAPEDLDRNGVVGIGDILAVARVHGREAVAYPAADLDGDGRLTIGDMLIIDGARSDTPPAAPRSRRSVVPLVERWLEEARREDDGSAVYREGMVGLGRLLLTLRPAAFALLPNYPNPFNPETWIPFDLTNASDVSLRVYDAQGRRVRTITLGRLDAGQYHGRADAAYWDGRNELGERVASGVYIAELRAGDFSQRRRMVVRK